MEGRWYALQSDVQKAKNKFQEFQYGAACMNHEEALTAIPEEQRKESTTLKTLKKEISKKGL